MTSTVFFSIAAFALALIAAYLASIKNNWWSVFVAIAMLCTVIANTR